MQDEVGIDSAICIVTAIAVPTAAVTPLSLSLSNFERLKMITLHYEWPCTGCYPLPCLTVPHTLKVESRKGH